MENKTLGQKIEYYRKRAKMSQLDLEIAIGAGQGSISRIENDQVNPTKETIQKIIEILSLSAFEAGDIYNINIVDEFEKYSSLFSSLNSLKTLNSTIEQISKDLIKYVGGKYSVVFLSEDNNTTLKVSGLFVPQLVLEVCNKFLGYSLNNVVFNFNNPNHKKNFFVKSFQDNKISETNSVYEASYPLLSKELALIAQKVSGFELMMSLPLNYSNQKIGILGIVFDKKELSEIEKKTIINFANLIATTIFHQKNGK